MEEYSYLRKDSKNEFKRQGITYKRFGHTHKAFFEFLEKNIRVKKNFRVLEIGCGGGFFINEVSQRWKYYGEGWDLNESYLSMGAKEFKKVHFRKVGFFENRNIKNLFNMIFFRETLMCVKKPWLLINWACKYLKTGGYIAALEPDYNAAIIYPENKYWKSFYEKYASHCLKAGNENFAIGRELPKISLKSNLTNIKAVPIIEFNSYLERDKMKKFLDIEILSIKEDMPKFLQKTHYEKNEANKALNFLKNLYKNPFAYLQTSMTAILGAKVKK